MPRHFFIEYGIATFMTAPSRYDRIGFYVQLGLGVAVVAWGLFGFTLDWLFDANPPYWPDEILYRTLQLFVLNSGANEANAALLIARICACLLFLTLAYTTIVHVFSESWAGLRLDAFARGHDVVCGAGAAGASLARQIQEANLGPWGALGAFLRLRPTVVVIEADPDAAALSEIRARGGVIVQGDATDEANLAKARVRDAARVFLSTGSDDSNAEIAFDVMNLLATPPRRSPTPLRCYVHGGDLRLTDVFSDDVMQAARARGIEFRTFSASGHSAADLVQDDLASRRPSAERGEVEALYVILGFGPMGRAVAVEIAAFAHFENVRRPAFVIAAEDCESASDRFLAEFGAFSPQVVRRADRLTRGDVLGANGSRCDWSDPELRGPRRKPDDPQDSSDAEAANVIAADRRGVTYAASAAFVELPGHFADVDFVDMLQRLVDDPTAATSIIVCLENGRAGFDAAMLLNQRLALPAGRRVGVYVWLPKQAGFAAFLSKTSRPRSSGPDAVSEATPLPVPFGECRDSASLARVTDPEVEGVAARLHGYYVDRAPAPSDPAGKRPWSELAPTFRKADEAAAKHARIKLDAVGMEVVPAAAAVGRTIVLQPEPEAREMLARMEHSRWMAERLLDGWRYGETPDNRRRTRPQLVPWEDLSDDERAKDFDQVRALFDVLNSGPTRIVEKEKRPRP